MQNALKLSKYKNSLTNSLNVYTADVERVEGTRSLIEKHSENYTKLMQQYINKLTEYYYYAADIERVNNTNQVNPFFLIGAIDNCIFHVFVKKFRLCLIFGIALTLMSMPFSRDLMN